MKHDYLISYYDSFPSFFSEEGDYIEVSGGGGWYVQVSDHQPWGPFDNQKEAIESLLMEWERFEPNYWKEEE
jgi:hypothetical protein